MKLWFCGGKPVNFSWSGEHGAVKLVLEPGKFYHLDENVGEVRNLVRVGLLSEVKPEVLRYAQDDNVGDEKGDNEGKNDPEVLRDAKDDKRDAKDD